MWTSVLNTEFEAIFCCGENTTLTSLAIGGHDLRSGGARALADTLRSNTTLTKLDLREAILSSDDVDSLVTAVKANTTLLELDLRSVMGNCSRSQGVSRQSSQQ